MLWAEQEGSGSKELCQEERSLVLNTPAHAYCPYLTEGLLIGTGDPCDREVKGEEEGRADEDAKIWTSKGKLYWGEVKDGEIRWRLWE